MTLTVCSRASKLTVSAGEETVNTGFQVVFHVFLIKAQVAIFIWTFEYFLTCLDMMEIPILSCELPTCFTTKLYFFHHVFYYPADGNEGCMLVAERTMVWLFFLPEVKIVKTDHSVTYRALLSRL